MQRLLILAVALAIGTVLASDIPYSNQNPGPASPETGSSTNWVYQRYFFLFADGPVGPLIDVALIFTGFAMRREIKRGSRTGR
jgi:hypothetical protein